MGRPSAATPERYRRPRRSGRSSGAECGRQPFDAPRRLVPGNVRSCQGTGMTIMIDILMHVRHAIRLLLKAPGFTIAATLTLALGIGVNTTMFTIVHSVLLKDLPYREPQSLMRLI